MKKVRLCLLIFITCSLVPLQAAAMPSGLAAFATVGLSWGYSATIPTATLDYPDLSSVTLLDDTAGTSALLGEITREATSTELLVRPEEGLPPTPIMTAPVPEPSTVVLLAVGILGIAWVGRMRKRV